MRFFHPRCQPELLTSFVYGGVEQYFRCFYRLLLLLSSLILNPISSKLFCRLLRIRLDTSHHYDHLPPRQKLELLFPEQQHADSITVVELKTIFAVDLFMID